MANIVLGTFSEKVKANVLTDTPSVLSIGKRCMEQGYSFVRPRGKEPYLIEHVGKVIPVTVRECIPFVTLGEEVEVNDSTIA